MKSVTSKHSGRVSTPIKILGLSIVALFAILVIVDVVASSREAAKPKASAPYAFTQLGQACTTAMNNYDARINDLKKANDQVNASLEKATQAVAGNTDPSIAASYNSIATNASNDIAQNNTKISQLSDRRAQVSVCVDKANAQEDFSDSDVSNFRMLVAESAN